MLLGITLARRRSLRTDPRLAALLALLPFAFAYGLVYWGEQHIPSGLAAVLFGVLPLYTALIGGAAPPGRAGAPAAVRRRADRDRAGWRSRSSRASTSGATTWPGRARWPCCSRRSAPRRGTWPIKLRAAHLDAVVLNGWAMLGGGLLLLVVSGASEDWGEFAWTGESLGSIAYLAIAGSAIAFVILTVLLRQISARATSFLAMLLPFGALAFGAALYDEPVTARAAAGAGLVAAGLMLAQGMGLREPGAAARRGPGRSLDSPPAPEPRGAFPLHVRDRKSRR